MAAEHSAYQVYQELPPAVSSRYRDYQGVSNALSETLGGLLARLTAQVSDIRKLYDLATELDVRITGHQVPPSGPETALPKVVREGFIDQATERLNEIQSLVSGTEARLRNLTEKVGA